MGAARAAGCHGEAKRLPKLCATNGFVPRSAPGSPFPPLLASPPTSPPAPREPSSGPGPAERRRSLVPLTHCRLMERPGARGRGRREAAEGSRRRECSPRATLNSIFCCALHHLSFQFW